MRATTAIRQLLCALALLCAFGAPAATPRIASGFDPQTIDPHALALLYPSPVVTQIYEALVAKRPLANTR